MVSDRPHGDSVAQQLDRLRAQRRQLWPSLGAIADAQLERPTTWRDHPSDVRFLLLRLADRDDERRVLVGAIADRLGWRQSTAQRVLAEAAEARGQLRAALVGVGDDALDRSPAPGEWTIRQVLGHVENVERRYLLQTEYAVERMRRDPSLPIRVPDDRLPPNTASEPAGGLAEVLDRLDVLRMETVARLADLADEDLTAPTIWARWNVDVRFRLHRFAVHERQHTVQIQKTLDALGHHQNEAQRILGQAEVVRGALEGALIGLPDDLAVRDPGDGLPSVRDLLMEALAEEAATADEIRRAIPSAAQS